MTSKISGVGFTPNEVEELPEYRPVNRLAIAAFLAGILSATGLIMPVLWIVPAVAVILSLVALRQIDASSVRPSGRGLAVTAFCLALVFGSWGVVRYVSGYFVLMHRARAQSQDWLNLVRDGRLYEAHQLTLEYATRAKPGESLQSVYTKKTEVAKKEPSSASGSESHDEAELATPDPTPPELFAEWREQPAVKLLASLGTKAQIRFERNVRMLRLGYGRLSFELTFTLLYDEGGKPVTKQVDISIERDVLGGVANWKVSSISDAAKPL